MKVWRVTFHWLGKDSGFTDVLAEDIVHAATKGLAIEQKKGCRYTEENITKIELISEPEEIEVE